MTAPTTPEELADAVRSMPRLLAVGAGTKPGLVAADTPRLSTSRLTGIVEYEPEEFTFTAWAGTPVREIAAALAGSGQYLPFDPMLSQAGATLGGTVASGLSGPRRFRYGGLRDFILGARFVDGTGRLLRMGGKVVKNAAGFDLPKFFVGSLGRFGVLAEITFKVFPQAASTRTLRLTVESTAAAATILKQAATARWEADALDLLPDGRTVLMRLAAPEPALDAISREVLARWDGAALSAADAIAAWEDIGEFRWVPADALLAKVPLTPDRVPALHDALARISGTQLHVSAGGNVGFVSTSDAAAIEAVLGTLQLRGMTLRGPGPLWLAGRGQPQITRAVKDALDPQHRFPSLDE